METAKTSAKTGRLILLIKYNRLEELYIKLGETPAIISFKFHLNSGSLLST